MKKFLVLLLCVLLFASLCPFAAAEEADKKVHECSGIVFDRPLHGFIRGTLESGNYYIDGEAAVIGHVKIRGEVNLCINGYPISVQSSSTFLVLEGGVFNIYDCTGDGLIGFYKSRLHNHPLTVNAGGTANIYGGWLYGKNGSNAVNSAGTVNIYGGKIESGWTFHCAVRNSGEVNLYGGELIGSIGISQRDLGKLHIRGNEFTIRSERVALQYVTAATPLYIDTPYYRWRTDPEGEFTSSADEPYRVSEKDLYLEFAPLLAPIRYELGGGTLENEAPREYVCGEGCALPETVRRGDDLFLGWYDAPEGGRRYDEIPADCAGELVLYARFEPTATPTPAPTPVPAPEAEMAPEESSRSALWICLAAGAVLAAAVLAILLPRLRRKDAPAADAESETDIPGGER